MKPSILLLGAGGHARSCVEAIESGDAFHIAGFVGRASEVGTTVLGYPVLGSDDDLERLRRDVPFALVAIGQIKSAEARARAFARAKSAGFELPVVRAATAVVSSRSSVGEGTAVFHGAIINAGAVVGANCIVNTRALVEHDCVVGANTHVSTGAILNGGVTVGTGTFVGSGAVVHPGVTLGDRAVVGARTLVVRDVASDRTVRDEA